MGTAVKNTRTVGSKTAEFIVWLVTEQLSSYDRIHVLGSSLGAQAAGYVGHFTDGRLSRITGLDPSGPLFYSVAASDRLDRTDAQFVDIIHTAGYWVGTSTPSGHVDIWPNGGKAPQPGCEKSESLDLSCSHFLAWKLFSESILTIQGNNGAYVPLVGIKCESLSAFLSSSCCQADSEFSVIGELIDPRVRGSFFLKTFSQSFYAMPPVNATQCIYVKDLFK